MCNVASVGLGSHMQLRQLFLVPLLLPFILIQCRTDQREQRPVIARRYPVAEKKPDAPALENVRYHESTASVGSSQSNRIAKFSCLIISCLLRPSFSPAVGALSPSSPHVDSERSVRTQHARYNDIIAANTHPKPCSSFHECPRKYQAIPYQISRTRLPQY